MHLAVIWQRFLPYHVARIKYLQHQCEKKGWRVTAIEVASQDATYGFDESRELVHEKEKVCCFPGTSYHDHLAHKINRKVFEELAIAKPEIVFAPATPFPEGMAAIHYRMQAGCKVIMMDDAWEVSDRKQGLTRIIKTYIHKNIDGVFVPFPSHLQYFERMGFPKERIFFGVDVVDNNAFITGATRAKVNSIKLRAALKLPEKYFLFVGRFLMRKGLDTLISAFRQYRQQHHDLPWDLVLVGDGPFYDNIQIMAKGIEGIKFVGQQQGEILQSYYGLANALIVPSEIDPWGLVVNEGMASGLPVIVSSGCGASALIDEGKNGWCFDPGNTNLLVQQMRQLTSMSESDQKEMGARSMETINDLSLDRFVDSVFEAVKVSRRENAGVISYMLSKLWKGKVSIN